MARRAENYLDFVKLQHGYYSNYPIYAQIVDTGGQVVNVKSFGAAGNGATDDTQAINNAIASLPSGGGVIYFPKGAYVISSTIAIKQHGVWLRGEAYSDLFADQAAEQSGLTGISRIVAATGFSASTPMIQFGVLGTTQIWTGGGIEGLIIKNGNVSVGDAIQILNVQHARVVNSSIQGAKRGIYVQSDQPGGISNVDIENNLIQGLSSSAIYLDSGSQENYVRHNYIAGAVGRAVFVGGVGNTLLQNHIETTTAGTASLYRKGTGIYLAGSQNFIIGNDTLTTDNDGIYCSGSLSTIVGNTIRNPNNASNGDGSGIFTEGTITSVIIDGNNINDGNSKMVYGIKDASATTNGVLIGINQINGATSADMTTVNHAQKAWSTLGKASFGQLSPTATADIAASTTGASSLRIRSGTAPTSPNDGDIWYDGTNLKIQIGASTKTFTVT